MTPLEYQRLASRTECDQKKALERLISCCHTKILKYNPQFERDEEVPQTEYLLGIRLMHAALGLAGDAGEVAANVERCVYYGRDLDKTNMVEELGDCLWYIAEACNALGISMEKVMEANIAKLRKRYPHCYSDQCAAEENRDRNAEAKVVSAFAEQCNLAEQYAAREPIKEQSVVMTKADYDRITETSAVSLETIEPTEFAAEVRPDPTKPKSLTICRACGTPTSDRGPMVCPECQFALR